MYHGLGRRVGRRGAPGTERPDGTIAARRPYDHAVDFYSDVLLELVTALGAALFIANAYALIRRSADRREGAREAVARSRPGSPVRKEVRATRSTLDQAPLARDRKSVV